MSDTSTPEPAVPATTADDAVTPVAETPADTTVAPAAAAPVAVVEKKKRGIGAWSFVLGLLTALADIGFVVFVVVALVGTIADATAGDFSGIATALGAAGLALLALFVFFGGFLSAGVAALLGIIALISGRGRVLGFFGLLFGAAALVVRVLLLSAGFTPDLG
jgi:hypothetical protein